MERRTAQRTVTEKITGTAPAPGPRPPSGDENELAPAFLAAAAQNGAPKATDRLGRRLLAEYGGMFLARGVKLPPRLRFADEAELSAFQKSAEPTPVAMPGGTVELQPAAAAALTAALVEARAQRVTLTARGDASAARRSYAEATGFWEKRVEGALAHWIRAMKLAPTSAAAIRAMPHGEQIEAVLEEEDRGHFFASTLDKTVMRSTAPPGSSQHHAMLALDVAEYDRPAVRALLARHGFHQTVLSDLPHFTYLGRPESELPALGLAAVVSSGRRFWVPARRQ